MAVQALPDVEVELALPGVVRGSRAWEPVAVRAWAESPRGVPVEQGGYHYRDQLVEAAAAEPFAQWASLQGAVPEPQEFSIPAGVVAVAAAVAVVGTLSRDPGFAVAASD